LFAISKLQYIYASGLRPHPKLNAEYSGSETNIFLSHSPLFGRWSTKYAEEPNSQVSEEADAIVNVTGADANYCSAISFIYSRPVSIIWVLRWLNDPYKTH
jgi:hypothetical protein